jgi:hypothetical protein
VGLPSCWQSRPAGRLPVLQRHAAHRRTRRHGRAQRKRRFANCAFMSRTLPRRSVVSGCRPVRAYCEVRAHLAPGKLGAAGPNRKGIRGMRYMGVGDLACCRHGGKLLA